MWACVRCVVLLFTARTLSRSAFCPESDIHSIHTFYRRKIAQTLAWLTVQWSVSHSLSLSLPLPLSVLFATFLGLLLENNLYRLHLALFLWICLLSARCRCDAIAAGSSTLLQCSDRNKIKRNNAPWGEIHIISQQSIAVGSICSTFDASYNHRITICTRPAIVLYACDQRFRCPGRKRHCNCIRSKWWHLSVYSRVVVN